MTEFQKKSFRDPSGFVIIEGDRVYRAIKKDIASNYRELFLEAWYLKLVEDGKIQRSIWVESESLDKQFDWVEHPKFVFPLFPHEICAEQLYESALLTIEIAQIAFENGYILKDASAWNVVFDQGSPIFCDVTSFEVYDKKSLWHAYGQFCRHFIIPLLLYKYLKISPAQLFLSYRDGVPPAQARKMLGYRALFNGAAIETVYLPAYLESSRSQKNSAKEGAGAHIGDKIYKDMLTRLGGYVRKLRPFNQISKSTWSDYEAERAHYSESDLDEKQVFVNEALRMCPPSGSVLDLGCNQGEYSLLAAGLGLKTVATDFDETALIKLQARSKSEGVSVGLLNICQPTPAIGWNNEEQRSFLDKSKGHFDLVLCLGLIHHLLMTERIPLNQVCDFLLRLTKQYLLIEWVDSEDEKFQQISLFSQDLYRDLTQHNFESMIGKKFKIINKKSLIKARRTFYLLEKIS